MAETAVKNAKSTDVENNQFESEFKQDYLDDWDIHKQYVQTFDPYEAMLVGMVYDSVSKSTDSSKISDSYAATLAIERAARVMGKLPDGVTESMTDNDQGKAAFMDILRQKWVYPNANSQHKFPIKLRLWQLYSSVYGYMPMFYDWNVAANGYIGPDCWLWNPRNLIPQQGRVSIADMDYVTALTWVGKKFLEDKLDELDGSEDSEEAGDEDEGVGEEEATENEPKEDGGWDREALMHLIELADHDKSRPDQQKDTQVARSRTPQAVKRGIALATRYEAGEDGEWVTFAPDHGYTEVRRIKNPHHNGRIPFVIKYSQPLFDSFYGLGDFQRAKPLQFARDALTNFYFSGIKMNLIPPIVVNANGVLKHTIDYRPGGVMQETIPNSIRRLETSTAGLATYQAAQQNLTGSLLSLFGSQNASGAAADTLNPSQGKTPAAIGLYSGKEADRDGQEREYLESALEELTDGFFSLIANIGTESIPVNLFSEDIQDIVDSGMGDLVGLFTQETQGLLQASTSTEGATFQANASKTGGQLVIDPSSFKDIEFRFNINSGSTAKMNKDAQRQALEDFVGVIGKLQNVLQADPRVKVEWPNILKAFQGVTDIPNVNKFITIDPNAQPTPAPAQQPSATAVSTPGGQVHEVADLTKLYAAAANNPGLRSQIIQALGFDPANAQEQPEPTEPEPTPEPEPPTTTVAANGQAFHDPHIAAAASAVHKM